MHSIVNDELQTARSIFWRDKKGHFEAAGVVVLFEGGQYTGEEESGQIGKEEGLGHLGAASISWSSTLPEEEHGVWPSEISQSSAHTDTGGCTRRGDSLF